MIPIKYLKENTELVKESLRKRKDSEKLAWVDEALEKNEKAIFEDYL